MYRSDRGQRTREGNWRKKNQAVTCTKTSWLVINRPALEGWVAFSVVCVFGSCRHFTLSATTRAQVRRFRTVPIPPLKHAIGHVCSNFRAVSADS